MIKNKHLILLLSGLLAFTSTVSATENDPIQVLDPWIREAPPNMTMQGGFLRLKNNGDNPVVIVGSSSPLFKKVEIHRTIIQDGTARMVEQESIKVSPGSEEVFEPGGLHLMMMMPSRAIKKGDLIPINIELENGQIVEFTATVKTGLH